MSLQHTDSASLLAKVALPPGVDRYVPVAEFLAQKGPSGRPRYCSRAHLYKLRNDGKIKFKYSGGKPFVDMVSWFSHLED